MKEPTDEFVRSIPVTEILPQQPPFIAIGRLEHFDMKVTKTSTEICNVGFFTEGNHLSEAGIIENIAQTCAARIGYINKYILLKEVQIGFIGAIRNLEITRLPEVGETIVTTVEVEEEIFGMILANATVTSDGFPVAMTEIKIAIQ